PVVGVEERDQRRLAELDAAVARGRRTALGLAHDRGAEPLGDRRAVVGRAVVDDDDFVRRLRLLLQRLQRERQERGGIVRRDHDRDVVAAHARFPRILARTPWTISRMYRKSDQCTTWHVHDAVPVLREYAHRVYRVDTT